MKYSVKGQLSMTDATELVEVVNNYVVWHFDQKVVEDDGLQVLVFEIWVNTEAELWFLWDDLKVLVDAYGERIEWHECHHDDPLNQPCVIAEVYVKG